MVIVIDTILTSMLYIYVQFCIAEYYKVVTKALREYSHKCVETIQDANRHINILLYNTIGQLQVQKKFK